MRTALFWVITQRVMIISYGKIVPKRRQEITSTRCVITQKNILVYNSNEMHKSQGLFNLTTALHVSGVTITHLQEHKTTVTNRYTVLLPDAAVTVVLCSWRWV